MRGQTTKLLVGIGAVAVVAGLLYVSQADKDKPATTIAQNNTTEKSPADSAVPSVSLSDDHATTASPEPSSTVDSSRVASPTPRTTENPIALPSLGENSRPQPAETHAPVPPMAATEPKDHTGLSGVVPNISTPIAEPAATTSLNEDMPPNADKDVRPAAPVLPPIAPLDIASSSTTKPAGTAAQAPAAPTGRVMIDVAPVKTADKPVAAKPADKTDTTSTVKVADKPKEHVVQPGETLSSIAVKHYGSTKYVKDIMKANPKVDPKRLYVKAKLVIPDLPGAVGAKAADEKPTIAAPAVKTTDKVAAKTTEKTTEKVSIKEPQKSTEKVIAPVPPADPNRSYTVQPGEGWYDLARKFLGDGKNYPELYEYNKERVGGDPHLLRAGTVIELPPRAKMPAKTTQQPAPAPAAK